MAKPQSRKTTAASTVRARYPATKLDRDFLPLGKLCDDFPEDRFVVAHRAMEQIGELFDALIDQADNVDFYEYSGYATVIRALAARGEQLAEIVGELLSDQAARVERAVAVVKCRPVPEATDADA